MTHAINPNLPQRWDFQPSYTCTFQPEARQITLNLPTKHYGVKLSCTGVARFMPLSVTHCGPKRCLSGYIDSIAMRFCTHIRGLPGVFQSMLSDLWTFPLSPQRGSCCWYCQTCLNCCWVYGTESSFNVLDLFLI